MSTYDLVVLGGGTAGLTAAVGAASQGARTLLVERDRTGGDCLWTGCVPSKALIGVAARAHTARSSGHLGIHAPEVRVDFAAAMAHVKQAIAAIAPHDSPERLRREGVEVVSGTGRFTAADRLEVAGRVVRFRNAMIATGAAPLIPPIPGLRGSGALTSDTLWDLTELPRRLVVLGGGPIGSELGQAFARLGSQVTVVEMADALLPREEPGAGALVAASLIADGVDVRVGTRAVAVREDAGTRHLVVERDGRQERIAFDEVLVAVGRRPNTHGIGLKAAGVTVDDRGAVVVDERLRTTNPRIHAGGDVTLLLPFTHTASTHGATVVQNALFGLRRTVDHGRIPWVTFTAPEVARIGLSVAEAEARYGDRARVRTASHTELDRAVAEGVTGGFATLVGDPKGRLVGATVVGPRAGEVIGEVVAWMASGAKLTTITRSTHAYPTWNQDLTAASLEELRAGLERLRPVTRLLLWIRRLRPRARGQEPTTSSPTSVNRSSESSIRTGVRPDRANSDAAIDAR
jgi:pyruvate/2-oxoglutarate dehydrogenase complex dihydrolipoamide dehydrogenase (E3) component